VGYSEGKETDMIIELAKVIFTNDLFSTMLPDGGYLVLNKIDESLLAEEDTEACDIKAINVEMLDVEGNTVDCPCVIGLSNDKMEIRTEHKEYEGEVLTPDNMEYCTIEIYD
jgi:hypothetical protein